MVRRPIKSVSGRPNERHRLGLVTDPPHCPVNPIMLGSNLTWMQLDAGRSHNLRARYKVNTCFRTTLGETKLYGIRLEIILGLFQHFIIIIIIIIIIHL